MDTTIVGESMTKKTKYPNSNESNITNESQESSLLRKGMQSIPSQLLHTLPLTFLIVSQTMNFNLILELQSPSSEQRRDVQELMKPKNRNEDRQSRM